MYRSPPHYDINFGGMTSTVMYKCENFHQHLDEDFVSSNGLPNANSGGKPLVNGDASRQQSAGKHKAVSHHHAGGVSEFESRQLAVLTELQHLGSRLDKLSGTSDKKKRAGAQAKDVKRQKTESSCQEPEDPPVPETINLKEQPAFAQYESKAATSNQFPLNIVIAYSSPPPYALFVLASLVRERASPAQPVGIKAFVHSTLSDVVDGEIKIKIQNFNNVVNDGTDLSQCQHVINFIWKKTAHPKGSVLLHGTCVESQTSAIYGEANIAKYLGALAGFYPSNETAPQGTFLTLDYWGYTADGFSKSAYSEVRPSILKEMERVLDKRSFLMGDRITYADLMVWASFYQPPRVSLRRLSKLPLPPKVKNWFMTLNSVKQFQGARIFVPLG